MCGKCCPGCWKKIKPQLGVEGLDPADPTSGYKLAKRVVIYTALVMFVVFHLVCAALFFGVAGGIRGGNWFLMLLPYQMFLIVVLFGLGTITVIQKAGVPCPMKVRGIVFYGAPQNNTVQTQQKQPDAEKAAPSTPAEENPNTVPLPVASFPKAQTMPAKMGWVAE